MVEARRARYRLRRGLGRAVPEVRPRDRQRWAVRAEFRRRVPRGAGRRSSAACRRLQLLGRRAGTERVTDPLLIETLPTEPLLIEHVGILVPNLEEAIER